MSEFEEIKTPHYQLYRNCLPPERCEETIAQVFAFKKKFYTPENLQSHLAYLADEKPHRTSHAYAVASSKYQGILPAINTDNPELRDFAQLLSEGFTVCFNHNLLGLDFGSRSLFNVQEYYGGSERVPKHMDGELLEFSADTEGNLDIKRSIRPEKVAVLTLINDTDGGGTRIHMPDGTEEVVRGQAGDLLVFNNADCYHSVDALSGTVKRADGLLRMTVGWRSLGDKTRYYEKSKGTCFPVTMSEANTLIENWYLDEWPKQWEKIKGAAQKAAF